MNPTVVVKKNWLTRKPHSRAALVTLTLFFILFTFQLFFEMGLLRAGEWMLASPSSVFEQHQYWRLWTTLFAHSDFGHIIGNSMLFFPFAYYLSAYFSILFFPLFGLFMGGVINYLVLLTMGPQTHLLGISGVVYWMGAAWLSLFLLIDRRESGRRRFTKVLFITVVLFLPEAYKPEVSYLSHLLGYAGGAISGIGFFLFNQKKFRAAEVVEIISDEEIPLSVDSGDRLRYQDSGPRPVSDSE